MPIRERLGRLVDGICEHALRTFDAARSDRLWPSHYLGFLTNPLSIAYGAAGPALLLRRQSIPLPPVVVDWLRDREVTTDLYPPGLLIGSAGVAYAFCELGLEEEAIDIFEVTLKSPLRFSDPTMFLGVSGWGLVALYLFQRFGINRHLDMATSAAEYLLATAQKSRSGWSWPSRVSERVNFGFGYGSTGIGLFLAWFSFQTGESRFREAALKALEFDINSATKTQFGLAWGEHANARRNLPYWGHGSAGVAAAALRVGVALGDPELIAISRGIMTSLPTSAVALPCQVNGAAGIGDTYLDFADILGDQVAANRALRMAEFVGTFAIEDCAGLAMPGRWLSRISNDFATGSSGIGIFLQRLLRGGGRLLVDLTSPDRLLYDQVLSS